MTPYPPKTVLRADFDISSDILKGDTFMVEASNSSSTTLRNTSTKVSFPIYNGFMHKFSVMMSGVARASSSGK